MTSLMVQRIAEPSTDTLRFSVTVDRIALDGTLTLPPEPEAVVIFAQGRPYSRLSPRNRAAARQLNDAGFATLLVDLLTAPAATQAAALDSTEDLTLLARRLRSATERVNDWPETRGLPCGYLGSGAGATAALLLAAEQPGLIAAVVAHNGRPDLVGERLSEIEAPALLIVSGDDPALIACHRSVLALLPTQSALAIIPRARGRFEHPEAHDQVAQLAMRWFNRALR